MLKVSEMKAEYFPPKEDVILQNEAPTDFYILVTGAVVSSESWRLKYLISMLVKQWKLIFFFLLCRIWLFLKMVLNRQAYFDIMA